MIMAAGCGDGKDKDKDNNQVPVDGGKVVFKTSEPHEAVTRVFEMNSQAGCALDSDCVDGMFCFHGLCTSECSESNPCEKGTCSPNGRCLKSNGTRDLTADLNEARNSSVVDQIPGAEVMRAPSELIYAKVGATSAETFIVTAQNYDTISYVVVNTTDDTVSQLMESNPVVDPKTGMTTYTISVPVTVSSLGDQGSTEALRIETSVGSFEVAAVPEKPTAGLYDGQVSANQFGGVGLPIRFIAETTPEVINSYSDIKGITLYLPVSGADLFSPEVVKDASKTTWAKIKMTHEKANCMNGSDCWSANYSVNDFTFPKSELLDAKLKVNRSIRIEIAGYDKSAMMLDGYIRDIMAGVYREADSTGKVQWAKATMDGTFVVTRRKGFDKKSGEYSIHDHKAIQKEQLRGVSSAGAVVCTDANVAALMAFVPEDGEHADCRKLKTTKAYDASKDKGACLLEATNALLATDDLVSKILKGLLEKDADNLEEIHGFATLKDFMDDCARENGICKRRPEIVCAVDLLGRSYLTSDEANKKQVLANWHQLMRESYLGRQYSAWQNDTDVRRRWLENSAAPTFLASVLEEINTRMLKDWETKVFEAHRGVLAQQFNQTSLEVLTRVDGDKEINSSRDLVLMEFAEAWEGVSDALNLGLRRYDTLYQETTKRTGKAAEMRPYLFDLYYSGLIETAINRSTGNGSLNGAYGKNLADNVIRLRSLDQSFDDLVFMRDAEVATSTSLDPLSGNAKVLSDRKKLAKDTVAAAQAWRDKVFDKYDNQTISEAQIVATLSNTIESLQTEITAICGLPRGCATPNDAECAPRSDLGFCGFDIPADSEKPGDVTRIFTSPIDTSAQNAYYDSKAYQISDKDLAALLKEGYLSDKTVISGMDYYSLTNTGEAAEAILAYRAAVKDVDIAQADYIALSNKIDIARSTCEAYAAQIENWNKRRNELLDTIQKNVEKINSHYDNITDAERDKIKAELLELQKAYDAQSTYVSDWETLNTTYKTNTKNDLQYIHDLTNAGHVMSWAVGVADRATDVAGNFAEEVKKGIATIIPAGIASALDVCNMGFNIAITNAELDKDKRDVDHEFTTNLNELKNDLSIQKLELDLQKSLAIYEPYDSQDKCEAGVAAMLAGNDGDKDKKDDEKTDTDLTAFVQCRSEVVCDCSGASEAFKEQQKDIYSEISCPTGKDAAGNEQCKLETSWYAMGLDQWILSEQNAIDTLDEVNDTLRELFEVKDAYERDLQDLDFRRSEYLAMAQELLVKREQILKAQIAEYSALKHYYTVVQRAQMLQSQYNAASVRLAKIQNLYSTPAKIFSFSADLETVESKIELAKERIYDYVAAIEYLAVRPFVDLRRATYLARSTNDLDAIIDQLDTVASKCGAGEPSQASVEISAREMMGITQDFASMTMGERFRSVIAKGNIPINSLTRYTVDSNVRDLVKKGIDLRSGTFAVTIDSMNLATTCNAKIDSIAVQIVGDDIIKPGSGQNVTPTITIFYDGQTQLLSCQPNIEALVSTIGSKTSYGKYSTFIVTPTKISPTAKINEYGEDNKHLAGKPLVTSYTVLIDTQIGENSKIDWDKVEDIKLKVTYSYNDLFEATSECVKL